MSKMTTLGVPLLIVLAAAVAWSPPSLGASTASDPEIVFVRDRDLMVMNADGTDVRRLKRRVDPNNPSWSPDGGKIAYSRHGSKKGLYTVKINGRSNERLFSGDVRDLAWSPVAAPDGEFKIAFCHVPSGETKGDVFIMNTDGSDLQNLTDQSLGNFYDIRWSPDATQLSALGPYNLKVFDLDENDDGRVVITDWTSAINLSGSPLKALKDAEGTWLQYGDISWSHDGETIVIGGVGDTYDGIDGSFETSLWLIPLADPVDAAVISSTAGDSRWEWSPCWSADDSQILCVQRDFTGNGVAGATRRIVRMDADGTDVTTLYSTTKFVGDLDWKR